jgi:hypothetical protein
MKMTPLDTDSTRGTCFSIESSNVPAARPHSFTVTFDPGTKGETIVTAAITQGFGTVGSPVAVDCMHEIIFICPFDHLFGLFLGDLLSQTPIEKVPCPFVHLYTYIPRTITGFIDNSAIAVDENNVISGIDDLIQLIPKHDDIVSQSFSGLISPFESFDCLPVLFDKQFEIPICQTSPDIFG